MKVLYLSPWYPHRYDAMSGLFVRKHAEAVARNCEVCTLYLYADDQVKNFDVVDQTTNGVREIYVYFPFVDRPLLRPLSKLVGFLRAFRKGYKYLETEFGRPDVTQANVLTRCGVLAYWLKIRWGIPYVIVEHWTRYLPQNFNFHGLLRRWLSRLAVSHASWVMPVSGMLGDAMRHCGLRNEHYEVVNNVVDDFFFKRINTTVHEKFKFLHISCFIERAKNICGILRAVKCLYEKRQDFSMTIVGTGPDYDEVMAFVRTLDLPDGVVEFVGEQSPLAVCDYLGASDAFVLFSNYENAPVVISESLATGTPIISTNVGGIPDMVDGESGCLIAAGDESALCETMDWMIDHCKEFDSEKIREKARRYSYEAVGNHLVNRYKDCLSK